MRTNSHEASGFVAKPSIRAFYQKLISNFLRFEVRSVFASVGEVRVCVGPVDFD